MFYEVINNDVDIFFFLIIWQKLFGGFRCEKYVDKDDFSI